MAEALPPGSTIGILGGGQLGRMLAIAAARLGLKTHIYEPGAAPAGDVSAALTTAAWDDGAALDAFAAAVDVVTLEFENVPVAAVERLAERTGVFPGARVLAIAQDRLAEKDFLNGIDVPTAPYQAVETAAEIDAAAARLGPGILKTRRLGYDGKGQARIDRSADAAAALAAMAGAPAILEGLVPFARELSVIVARGRDGTVRAYDPGENVHRDGILRTTTVPGQIGAALAAEAKEIAARIVRALDHVGVMGVELFQVERQGWPALLVNEVAPRVHNSGHWTIEACLCDQFEQHMRAVAGWPLGDVARHSDARMQNLIGVEAGQWEALAAAGGGLHLYGKAETRPGRKMGHLTTIAPRRAPPDA